VLIHFPIALFISGVAFDFLAQGTKRRALAVVAYYNLLGAALTVIPALFTGLLAWQFQLEGQRIKGILLMHLVLGWTSAALIWIAYYLNYRSNQNLPQPAPAYRLALEAVAVAVVALTGHLGGFLSGVNVQASTFLP
jgi:uncharacterized membrane protein